MATTVDTTTLQARSIATELRLVRLEHRAKRLDSVLRELRRRARSHPAPHLIGQAINGFEAELSAVRKLLRETRDRL